MYFKSVLTYSITIFLSAFLLFQIQPMIAKMILPWFGGSAAVWITCMVFFQIFLLGGYIYAHLIINRLSARMQVIVHIVLLFISLFALPVSPGLGWKPAGGEQPVLQILGLLSCSVGLPYFLLSTTSPLVQVWYAGTYKAILPYRLFALSNVASLAGLLAYPFLIEPRVTLRQQSIGWSVLYGIFVILCFSLSLSNIKRKFEEKNRFTDCPASSEHAAIPPAFREKILWLVLSACATILLLSVTNHLTQDIASIPFLWILPLSLYLLTFILCFNRRGWYRRNLYGILCKCAIVLMLYFLFRDPDMSLKIVIPVFCAGLFLCCMFCHGELAARKPSPEYLTSFYLHLSLGGALGGVFVGLLAPNIFPGYFELPMGLFLCSILVFLLNTRRGRHAHILAAVFVFGVFFGGAKYVYAYFAQSLLNTRNFYGLLRVRENDKGKKDEYRNLAHGTTIHGSQFMAPERRKKPLTYYSNTSGAGRAILALQKKGPVKIGTIGLGAGTLAAYARMGDEFRFYEINPAVEEIAKRYFYYLSEADGKIDVVLGDGRLSLECEENQQFDLLAIDAFSGDSIPIHLLTRQAFEQYFRHLKPDGVLAIHVSNNHLDLCPVVKQLCRMFERNCVLIDDKKNEKEKNECHSQWVLVTADQQFLELPEIKDAAKELSSRPDIKVWTDDYNNLFQILK